MKKAIQQKLLYLLVLSLSSCALIVDPLDNGIPPIRTIEPAEVGSLLTKLSEVSPPSVRGAVVFCFQLAITIGLFTAFLINYIFAGLQYRCNLYCICAA